MKANTDLRKIFFIKFKKNRLALFGFVILAILYITCFILPEFFAPYPSSHTSNYLNAPPQRIRFIDKDEGFSIHPFIYKYEKIRDFELMRTYYELDKSKKVNVHFFSKGESYKLWGLFKSSLHFFTTADDFPVFIFGSDGLGRGLFSRILYGGRISLSIGLLGVTISIILGSVIGAAAGFFGGSIDFFMQRITEVIMSFPHIPLWMALSAVIPATWPPVVIFFCIILIMSLIQWGGLARQIRGMVFSLKEKDFIIASISFGSKNWWIIRKHVIPNVMSQIIVIATLSVPAMILGETSLSFLGVGLKPPVTSWGVLLFEVQRIDILRFFPGRLIPVAFVILTVICFNFVGDGLRDAADPFSEN